MSWAPVVTSLTKVARAALVEMPILPALRAVIVRGRSQGVGGRGVAFWVWLISRASAPCSVTVNLHIKFLEVINDASSCKASMDEVRDEEFLGVPDDI